MKNNMGTSGDEYIYLNRIMTMKEVNRELNKCLTLYDKLEIFYHNKIKPICSKKKGDMEAKINYDNWENKKEKLNG
jgi:hypothetical protein